MEHDTSQFGWEEQQGAEEQGPRVMTFADFYSTLDQEAYSQIEGLGLNEPQFVKCSGLSNTQFAVPYYEAGQNPDQRITEAGAKVIVYDNLEKRTYLISRSVTPHMDRDMKESVLVELVSEG